MIHVAALPGSPRAGLRVVDICERARCEAAACVAAGFDGVIIENMHDAPYLAGGVGPEIVAAMTAVGCAVRRETGAPLGVQILAGANCEALAAALACGADFVRVENFVFAHVADEGLMPAASAGPLLRYRRQIGAEHVRIVADVKKKHASHAITADIPLHDAVAAALMSGADGVVVTGSATGRAASIEDVRAARAAADSHVGFAPRADVGVAAAAPVGGTADAPPRADLSADAPTRADLFADAPTRADLFAAARASAGVWIGSGLTAENLADYWPHADAFIVGSWVKRDGVWSNEVDEGRLRRFIDTVERLRALTAS